MQTTWSLTTSQVNGKFTYKIKNSNGSFKINEKQPHILLSASRECDGFLEEMIVVSSKTDTSKFYPDFKENVHQSLTIFLVEFEVQCDMDSCGYAKGCIPSFTVLSNPAFIHYNHGLGLDKQINDTVPSSQQFFTGNNLTDTMQFDNIYNIIKTPHYIVPRKFEISDKLDFKKSLGLYYPIAVSNTKNVVGFINFQFDDKNTVYYAYFIPLDQTTTKEFEKSIVSSNINMNNPIKIGKTDYTFVEPKSNNVNLITEEYYQGIYRYDENDFYYSWFKISTKPEKYNIPITTNNSDKVYLTLYNSHSMFSSYETSLKSVKNIE